MTPAACRFKKPKTARGSQGQSPHRPGGSRCFLSVLHPWVPRPLSLSLGITPPADRAMWPCALEQHGGGGEGRQQGRGPTHINLRVWSGGAGLGGGMEVSCRLGPEGVVGSSMGSQGHPGPGRQHRCSRQGKHTGGQRGEHGVWACLCEQGGGPRGVVMVRDSRASSCPQRALTPQECACCPQRRFFHEAQKAPGLPPTQRTMSAAGRVPDGWTNRPTDWPAVSPAPETPQPWKGGTEGQSLVGDQHRVYPWPHLLPPFTNIVNRCPHGVHSRDPHRAPTGRGMPRLWAPGHCQDSVTAGIKGPRSFWSLET